MMMAAARLARTPRQEQGGSSSSDGGATMRTRAAAHAGSRRHTPAGDTLRRASECWDAFFAAAPPPGGREMTRRECEAKGENSMYSQLQPFSRPELTEMMGKRIDALCSFNIDVKKGTAELRWCQGKVLKVVEGAWDPTVRVKWDAQLDARGYKVSTITNQRLLPSRWRKDKEDRWRTDVAIDIERKIDNESDEHDKDEEDSNRSEFGTNSEESDEELSDD